MGLMPKQGCDGARKNNCFVMEEYCYDKRFLKNYKLLRKSKTAKPVQLNSAVQLRGVNNYWQKIWDCIFVVKFLRVVVVWGMGEWLMVILFSAVPSSFLCKSKIQLRDMTKRVRQTYFLSKDFFLLLPAMVVLLFIRLQCFYRHVIYSDTFFFHSLFRNVLRMWRGGNIHSPPTRQSHFSYALKPVCSSQTTIRSSQTKAVEKIDTAANRTRDLHSSSLS